MSEKIISAKEAASILDISDRMVRYLLESGDIEGFRLSNQWAIKEESVLAYKQQRDNKKNKPD